MQRRDFLRGVCRLCMLGAAGVSAVDLPSCSPAAGNNVMQPQITGNSFSVPLTAFDKDPLQIISPKKYPYEVAVEKKQDGTYKALLLKCTHYDNQLQPAGTGFSCSLHGSRFDKDGKVIKGPAAEPLAQLKTSLTDNEVFIHL